MQSSKYLNSCNVLLLVEYFYSRTKCVGGGIPNKVYLGEIDDMDGPIMVFEPSVLTPPPPQFGGNR